MMELAQTHVERSMWIRGKAQETKADHHGPGVLQYENINSSKNWSWNSVLRLQNKGFLPWMHHLNSQSTFSNQVLSPDPMIFPSVFLTEWWPRINFDSPLVHDQEGCFHFPGLRKLGDLVWAQQKNRGRGRRWEITKATFGPGII